MISAGPASLTSAAQNLAGDGTKRSSRRGPRGCRTRSGLLLMRALVDRVAFTTLDEHGTVVSLEKRLVYAKP